MHSHKRIFRQLHLRIHRLDQSGTILTFCLHLEVPHDYVISFVVWKVSIEHQGKYIMKFDLRLQ